MNVSRNAPEEPQIPAQSPSAAAGGIPGPVPPLPVQAGEASSEPAEHLKILPAATVAESGIQTGVNLDEESSLTEKVKTVLIGKARDFSDTRVFHNLSLIAFLAWVGLGADGLSSSCYGPEEAFRALRESDYGNHTYLAIFLALATAATVFIISACYSHIIEEFPSGGGGYLVASKLLGPKIGAVAGCALLVDYALTITVSIAALGDALFGFLPNRTSLDLSPADFKIAVECVAIVVLIVMNLRGVKESVLVLLPIFIAFLVTHAVLILGTVIFHASDWGTTFGSVANEVKTNAASPTVGLIGMLLVFFRAYSLGGGTYTGIEAVSNSMPVMREPRVATGKRTMRYMAFSLAIAAGGLMIAYLLLDIQPLADKSRTMNHLLCDKFVEELKLPIWLGGSFVLVTMISEASLLFVAAQAGFIDGPRVLANMARDSWMPHWFANLSERLATHNGVLVMGISAMAALWATGGNTTALVIMYSINVFVTFSLSMIGMSVHWYRMKGISPIWTRRLALFASGGTMCVAILAVTVYEKFWEGGWRTLMVTGVCVALAFLIHRYYDKVSLKLQRLNSLLDVPAPPGTATAGEPQPNAPTAAVLVGGYNGLGIHTFLNALAFGPGKFQNVVFVSVGVIDSGNFKGADAVDELRRHTEATLEKYVDYARRLGLSAVGYMALGTDPVDELEQLCVAVKKRFSRATFFAGQLVFQKDTWYQRLLHNETAYSLQRRLQWDGVPMVILPTRVK